MTGLFLHTRRMQGLWPRHRFVRILMLGTLWGISTGAMEAVTLPVLDGSWSSFALLLFSNMSAWSVVGVGIAWLVECAQIRLERPFFLAAYLAVGALAFSALVSSIFSIDRGPALGISRVFPNATDPFASFLYQAWIVVFYGGLYAVAWTFSQRAERTRALLEQAQIARIQSETLLGDAQLEALRGHVDSRFLLGVMHEIEHRYNQTRESADRLMDVLVAFLRLAMPGVRSGCSTLASELALARIYADLCADVDRQRTWLIDAPERLPQLPFPPLLLLPVLDRLAVASTAQEGTTRVFVTNRSDCVCLAFDSGTIAGSDWLSPELAYRIRVGLSTLFGHGWSMSFRETLESSAPTLLLSMQTSRTAGDGFPPDASSPFHQPRKELHHES